MAKKIVVLGGSFNPPTKAHMALLKAAMNNVCAEVGVFVPTSDAYVRNKMVKAGESICLPAETRFGMLAAMCQEEPNVSVSDVELHVKVPVTYDSMCRIAERNPGAELYFVTGADKLKSIPHWRKADEFIRRFKFIVSGRKGVDVTELVAKNRIPSDFAAAFATVVDSVEGMGEVSSSEVRRRFMSGDSYDDLLHPAVAEMLSRFTPADFPPLGFAEWAKMTSKSSMRGMQTVLKKIYELNNEIFAKWAHGEDAGVSGGLGAREAFLSGTRVYTTPFDVSAVPMRTQELRMGCVNADCVAVAESLADQGLSPAILNLASRRKPGGGYDSGRGAQEEYLCQVSTLSQSLYQYYKPVKCVKEAGVEIKFNAYPLDINFGGIYSPNVTFFREGKAKWYALREKSFRCGVITVAALSFREPNAYCNEERRYMSADGSFTSEGDAIQLNKVRTIYRLALKNGHDSIVLGAFGCGVNKLPSAAVADQFRRVFGEPEFRGKFSALVFAILEGKARANHPTEENGKFAPFYRVFGRWN